MAQQIPNRVLRWAIMGTGNISHDFALALNLVPSTEHEIVAVAAREQAKAKEFINQLGLTKAKACDYDQLAADKSVDIVYIGTMHLAHFPCSMKMLEAGHNVLCEKPLGLTGREVKRMIAKAKEKGVFFSEALWTRYFPAYDQLRKELNAKAIGDIFYLQMDIGVPLIPRTDSPDLELVAAPKGNGALLALGSYPIQLATLIFGGKPEKIVASGYKQPNEKDDLTSCITLHYPGKKLAQLNVSFEAEFSQTAKLHGTDGEITIPAFDHPESLTTPKGTVEFPLLQSQIEFIYGRQEGFMYEVQEIRRLVLSGAKESPKITLAESEEVAVILDEIFKQLGVVYSDLNP